MLREINYYKKYFNYPKNLLCAIINHVYSSSYFFVSEEAESKLEASLEFAEDFVKLDQKCKEILYLYFKNKMTLNQIGIMLNMSSTKVGKLLHESLDSLNCNNYIISIYKNGFTSKEEYINSPINIDDHIIKLKLSLEAYNLLLDNEIIEIKMLIDTFYNDLTRISNNDENFKEIVKKVYDAGFEFKYFDSDVLDDNPREITANDKIYKLNLSDEYYKRFIDLGFKTIGDLIKYSSDELVKAEYIKSEEIDNIINTVNNHGFEFATNRVNILKTNIISDTRRNMRDNGIRFSNFDFISIPFGYFIGINDNDICSIILSTACYASNSIKKWIKENPDKLLSVIINKGIYTIRCNENGDLNISR